MTFQSAQALSILDSLSDGLLVQTVPTGGVVHVNPGFLELLVCDRTLLAQRPDGWIERIYPDDQPQMRQWWQRLMAHPAPAEHTYRVLQPTGQLRWIQCRSMQVQASPGATLCVATLHVDVTQQRQEAAAQLLSDGRLQTIFGPFLIGAIGCDARGRILWCNDAFCQMLDYPPGSLTHQCLQDLIAPFCRQRDFTTWLDNPCPWSQELEFVSGLGQLHWMLTTIAPLQSRYQQNGAFFCMIQDITRYKQADTELRASLKETEVLIAEIHHRVKNNLQIISSLLELQANRTRDTNAKRILLSSQDRVLAMSLIHETLYQSDNLAQIDFALYVRRLVAGVSRAYGANPLVDFTLNLDPAVVISTNLAVPLGLILNELVTNALKHSFTGSCRGGVMIDLQSLTQRRFQLSVSQPAGRLPDDFSMEHTSSMGLQIVTLLTQNIGATLSVQHQPTAFQVVFYTNP